MFYRQKILLNFLADKEYLSPTKLQKMLFLFCKKHKYDFYSFVPYQYGGYSFQAQHDLYTLEKKHFWIKKYNKSYTLHSFQDKAKITLKEKHAQEIQGIKRDWSSRSENGIIRYSYEKYPYYAIHSNLLEGSMADLKDKVLSYKPKAANDAKIFTIGYEGRSVEQYFNIFLKNDIKLLCDVRANPSSRKYGFSKKTLQHICEQFGILYQHIPELGIASASRKNLHEPKDYAQLFRRYRAKTLNNTAPLNQIKKIIDKYKRIALTCFEADIHCCHRKSLAEKLKDMTKTDIRHL